MPFDVAHPELLLQRLGKSGFAPSHLYYFATPRIRHNKSKAFDHASFNAYIKFYVNDFEKLIMGLVKECSHPLTVLYPSSVFVNELPAGFAEYTAAKAEGEALCARMNSNLAQVKAVVYRFPRVKTDQTASLLPQNHKPALPEVLQALKQCAS
jgi:hypothetical protein